MKIGSTVEPGNTEGLRHCPHRGKTVTKPLALILLGLPLSEKQIPQVIENHESGEKSKEALERAGVRPKQVRYQAALRPDNYCSFRSKPLPHVKILPACLRAGISPDGGKNRDKPGHLGLSVPSFFCSFICKYLLRAPDGCDGLAAVNADAVHRLVRHGRNSLQFRRRSAPKVTTGAGQFCLFYLFCVQPLCG